MFCYNLLTKLDNLKMCKYEKKKKKNHLKSSVTKYVFKLIKYLVDEKH